MYIYIYIYIYRERERERERENKTGEYINFNTIFYWFLCPRHNMHYGLVMLFTLLSSMLWDMDLIFGMWVYNDEQQIERTFRFGWMIFGGIVVLGLWKLTKYLVVYTIYLLCYEIWTWFFLK